MKIDLKNSRVISELYYRFSTSETKCPNCNNTSNPSNLVKWEVIDEVLVWFKLYEFNSTTNEFRFTVTCSCGTEYKVIIPNVLKCDHVAELTKPSGGTFIKKENQYQHYVCFDDASDYLLDRLNAMIETVEPISSKTFYHLLIPKNSKALLELYNDDNKIGVVIPDKVDEFGNLISQPEKASITLLSLINTICDISFHRRLLMVIDETSNLIRFDWDSRENIK